LNSISCYFLDVSSPVQRIPDPYCIFPFKEDFSSGNWLLILFPVLWTLQISETK
ncbi:hypothetical protein BHM03_00006703, partial [Ensete ventricosum]